jgi:hypothetical protein
MRKTIHVNCILICGTAIEGLMCLLYALQFQDILIS